VKGVLREGIDQSGEHGQAVFAHGGKIATHCAKCGSSETEIIER